MSTPSAAPKAIYAPKEYLRVGEGATKHFGFTRHLFTAATIGIGLGMLWKTWHWNTKRVIAQYYADLAKKEAREEVDRQAAIRAKFQELEAELLS